MSAGNESPSAKRQKREREKESGVWGCGRSADGELLRGEAVRRAAPLRLGPAASVGVQTVACGAAHSLLLSRSGELFAWGANQHGQCGSDGGGGGRRIAAFDALAAVVRVATGARFSAAVTADGGLYTWGDNEHGQLGRGLPFGSVHARVGRVPLATGVRVVAAACGAAHLLAVTSRGSVVAAGDGRHGQLGKSERERRRHAAGVAQLRGVPIRALACGARHSLVLATDGTVLAFGDNARGQLGIASRAASSHRSGGGGGNGSGNNSFSVLADADGELPALATVPTSVRLAARAIAVACGDEHSLVLAADGAVYGFGSNSFNQLGLGRDEKSSPAPIRLRRVAPSVAALAAGARHSVVLTALGGVQTFGQSGAGQLGRNEENAGGDDDGELWLDGFAVREPTDPRDDDEDDDDGGDDNNDDDDDGDVDLSRVALLAVASPDEEQADDDEEDDNGAAGGGARPQLAASGVAAGGMFSLVWRSAHADGVAASAAAHEPPLACIDARAVQRELASAGRELRELRAELARCESVRTIVGEALEKTRLEWFQSATDVHVDVFVDDDCSLREASLSSSDGGRTVVALLKTPPMMVQLQLAEPVSVVELSTAPATVVHTHDVGAQQTAVRGGDEHAPESAKKLCFKLHKTTPGQQWAGWESAAAVERRAAAAAAVAAREAQVGASVQALFECSFSALASANASFDSGRDVAGMLHVFDDVLRSELLTGEARGGALDKLQRCALDLSEQLVKASGAGGALATGAATWRLAARAIVPLLLAPTASADGARARNTRMRLTDVLARLGGQRRLALYAWLDERDGAHVSPAVREAVLSGSEPPARTPGAAALGRAARALLVHLATLLHSSDDEREAIVCARLLHELSEFNETRALLPRSAFLAHRAFERMSDMQLLTQYQRWRAKAGHQWSVLSCGFLLPMQAKRRVLRLEESIEQQTAAAQGIAQSLLADGAINVGAGGGVQINVQPDALRCEIEVRRGEHLLADALQQLRLASEAGRLKRPLFVKFRDEDAIDDGGVRREFVTLATRELLRSDYGLFERYADTNRFWLRAAAVESNDMLELVGLLFGVALYNRVLVPGRFPLPFWTKLLGKRPRGLGALAAVAPDVAAHLRTLLAYDGDVEADFELDFTCTTDHFGETRTHELLPNGTDVPVTRRNRERYVELLCDFRLNGAVARPFDAFAKGFHKVAGTDALRLLSPVELERLVCGAADDNELFDLSVLRAKARYDGGFDADPAVVRNFWQLVAPSQRELERADEREQQRAHALGVAPRSLTASHDDIAKPVELCLTRSERRRLLQFFSGSENIPIDGLESVRLTLQKNGTDRNRLISASTCYNVLLLPDYGDDIELLYERLLVCTRNSEGFAVV